LSAGISGLVPQGTSSSGFLETIRAVAGAKRVLPGPPGERRSIERNWLAGLTPRERAVFAMVSRGLSRKDIGRRLRISTGTVATHIRNILRKLMERGRE
jgi:two-component system nitrate/nitrite response regulator NarL